MLQQLITTSGKSYYIDPETINYVKKDGTMSYKATTLSDKLKSIFNVQICGKMELADAYINLNNVLGYNDTSIVFINGQTITITPADLVKLNLYFFNKTVTVAGLNLVKDNVYALDVANKKVNDQFVISDGGDEPIVPTDAITVDSQYISEALASPNDWVMHGTSDYGMWVYQSEEETDINFFGQNGKTYLFPDTLGYEVCVAAPWSMYSSYESAGWQKGNVVTFYVTGSNSKIKYTLSTSEPASIVLTSGHVALKNEGADESDYATFSVTEPNT